MRRLAFHLNGEDIGRSHSALGAVSERAHFRLGVDVDAEDGIDPENVEHAFLHREAGWKMNFTVPGRSFFTWLSALAAPSSMATWVS